MSFISSFNSRQPFQPIITGTDFYGTGVDEFLLPGSGTNQFNFGLGKGDLVKLVNQYNQTYGGKKAPNPAQIFPTITLPQNFDTGHIFNSQDLRVTKLFRYPRAPGMAALRRSLQRAEHRQSQRLRRQPAGPGLRPADQPLQQHLRHRRPAQLPVGHADFVLRVGYNPLRAYTR